MSNFLKIGKNGNLFLDGNLVTTDGIEDVNEYFMQLLGFYVTIEEGVTVAEVVHSVFGMKKFITGYFSEDYEVVRAFVHSSKFDRQFQALKFYKSFKVETDEFLSEDEYLYVLPEITFVETKEKGVSKLGDLPIIVDENISLQHNDVDLKLKTKFTFLDILTCIFDEMSACIKSGSVVTVA